MLVHVCELMVKHFQGLWNFHFVQIKKIGRGKEEVSIGEEDWIIGGGGKW